VVEEGLPLLDVVAVGCWQVRGGAVDRVDDGFDLIEPTRDDCELALLERGDRDDVGAHAVDCCACNG
jgi:hypothetical protein